MMTFRLFDALAAEGRFDLPMTTAWSLTELAECLGRQQLFTRQSPQRLKALREHAIVESAVSSNRIEGVEVDPSRVATVVFGHRTLRDREEEEVRGYRDALRLIHENGAKLAMSKETIRELHRLARAQTGDAGAYKAKDGDIIERYADGRSRVRFRPVPARETPAAMADLIAAWDRCVVARNLPPLVGLAALDLDFLCIHPFRDGNGRVSRLLTLLGAYHLGYEVGRYISLERLIEENKERYYETLEQSSRGWHDAAHDPWPFTNYLLYILRSAYREFEARVGQTGAGRGEKTELVLGAIDGADGPFRVADLQRLCPGVSVDLIRQVLKDLRAKGAVECLGRGRQAAWRKTGRVN
jgi:Fic family protein